MNKDNVRKKASKLFNVICIIIIISGSYMMFIYRTAGSERIQPYDDIYSYPLYSGKGAFEYWKTTLNDNQKILYEEMKEGFLQFKIYISTGAESMREDEIQETYAAVLLDHPEIFWMNSYNYLAKAFSNNVNVHKTIKLFYYYNQDEAKEINERIAPKYNKIIEEANKKESDYEKIKYVHDAVANIAKYRDYTEDERKEFQNIVSIFDKGETVCAGYSYGFKLIMDKLGIDCIVSRDVKNDNEDDNHIWNMVKLDNYWYNIDITWDTYYKDNEGKELIYNYFMKNNDEFYKTHKMQENIPQN